MPELPEVETIRASLAPLLAGCRLESVEILTPGVCLNPEQVDLKGWLVQNLDRRGKYLLINLVRPPVNESGQGDLSDPGRHMLSDSNPAGNPAGLTGVVHLRMTGKLLVQAEDEPLRPHTHIRLVFTKDGTTIRLVYQDVRRFGRLWFFPAGHEKALHGLATLGPEPLSSHWHAADLQRALSRHPKASIKAVLLDQTVVAGLGNIYVDESLFRAGLSPLRMAGNLTAQETAGLHHAIRHVLRAAIGCGGTSFRDYVDGLNNKGHFQYELLVYGRGGLTCKKCPAILLRRVVAGRGTISCPHCQPDFTAD